MTPQEFKRVQHADLTVRPSSGFDSAVRVAPQKSVKVLAAPLEAQ